MESNNNIETKRDLYRILDKFLVDNNELEELSAILSIFNIFKVLRIEDAEIRQGEDIKEIGHWFIKVNQHCEIIRLFNPIK